jgi:dolichol-phosphate mannosyltransferase
MIVVPTYNEKENIKRLVHNIFEIKPDFYITIVDDNSPDGTGQIADNLSKTYQSVHVIHRPKKQGLGPAYVEGFKYALSACADYF